MAVSFSTELQDQLLPLSGTINTNLSFIGDIRSFYQARVELEREYAKGLTALVGKAQSKHVQITDMLVAGEAPSKQVREGAGRNQYVQHEPLRDVGQGYYRPVKQQSSGSSKPV